MTRQLNEEEKWMFEAKRKYKKNKNVLIRKWVILLFYRLKLKNKKGKGGKRRKKQEIPIVRMTVGIFFKYINNYKKFWN